jgi:hypothetical protein
MIVSVTRTVVVARLKVWAVLTIISVPWQEILIEKDQRFMLAEPHPGNDSESMANSI